MHHPVNRGREGEWILEDLIPLRENGIEGDNNTASPVPFCQEDKQDFHLLTALLHAIQVIKDDNLEVVQA